MAIKSLSAHVRCASYFNTRRIKRGKKEKERALYSRQITKSTYAVPRSVDREARCDSCVCTRVSHETACLWFWDSARRSRRALSIVRSGERRRRVRARCTRGTATRVDYASSHSSLTLRRRRPGPAAHTQLSNIRGGPRWPPRSYKACLASVGPSCPTLYWSPSFLHHPPAPRRIIRTNTSMKKNEKER